MTRSRQMFALACTAIVVTACTTREAVPPAAITTTIEPGPATDPATTTEPETSTTTDTTVATTTIPETTAPTTTTPPPSGAPSSTATQFFAGGDPDGWLYVGRWTGDGWEGALDADGGPRNPAADAADVIIHEIGIDPIDGSVGATIELCSGERSGPVISPNARAPEVPGFGYRSMAFAADWDTEPRRIAVVDADIESYTAAGVASFEGTDVDASTGSVDQIVVSDLDGDGDSESLVAFGGDDFSSLLLIDADSGAATTVARDFLPVAAPAPGATTPPTTAPAAPVERFRVLAVADLNGDGLAEFVTHAWNDADEVTEVIVNTYDGSEVDSVLTASC